MNNHNYKIMVAYDSQRGIGKNNTIPWNFPEDLKRLKKYTINHNVVMATNTFNSVLKDFGKPLPKRLNIVLSNSIKELNYDNCVLVRSIDEIIEKFPEAWILGGSYLYRDFMPYVDEIYATEIEGTYDCDVFFPEINMNEWEIIETEPGNGYKFVTYKRILKS